MEMRILRNTLKCLGWNPMTRKGKAYSVSQELSNFDICVFPGTRLYRHEEQGDQSQTPWHHHFSFGFQKGTNTHAGVSLFFNKKKFDERFFMTAIAPSDRRISSRVAHVRYRKGRQDISVVGFYFPPKPTSTIERRTYWPTCSAMIAWAEQQTQHLPGRCLHMSFGDVNDDVGLELSSNSWSRVQSSAIGTARLGQEKIVGKQYRQYCEKMGHGICSTFFDAGCTYLGTANVKSYIDTWSLHLPHVRDITSYKTLRRLGVKLQAGNAGYIIDHIPVMMVLQHQMVHSKDVFSGGIMTS